MHSFHRHPRTWAAPDGGRGSKMLVEFSEAAWLSCSPWILVLPSKAGDWSNGVVCPGDPNHHSSSHPFTRPQTRNSPPSASLPAGGAAEPVPLRWLGQVHAPALPHQVDQRAGLLELRAVLLQVPRHRHKHKKSSAGTTRVGGCFPLRVQGNLEKRNKMG